MASPQDTVRRAEMDRQKKKSAAPFQVQHPHPAILKNYPAPIHILQRGK
jgi:hypothetical protein